MVNIEMTWLIAVMITRTPYFTVWSTFFPYSLSHVTADKHGFSSEVGCHSHTQYVVGKGIQSYQLHCTSPVLYIGHVMCYRISAVRSCFSAVVMRVGEVGQNTSLEKLRGECSKIIIAQQHLFARITLNIMKVV